MKSSYLCFLLFLPCLLAAAALQAGETGPWYLISQSEVRNIEQYREKSEKEKALWLSQVQRLNCEANILHQESANLNSLLSQARERNRQLEKSFNGYEAAASLTISQQSMQISELKTKNEKQAGQIRMFWIIVITTGAAVLFFIVFKVLRILKVKPFSQ